MFQKGEKKNEIENRTNFPKQKSNKTQNLNKHNTEIKNTIISQNFNNNEGKIGTDLKKSNKEFKNNIKEGNIINNKPNQQIHNQNFNNNNNNDLNMKSSFSFTQFKEAPLISLKNVGNSTYMSADVRLLSNIKSIVKYFMNEIKNIKLKAKNMPLSYNFTILIYNLYNQDNLHKEYSLENFHKTSLELNPIFKGNSTKNAIDFFIFILNYLNNEDKIFLNQKNIKDNKANIQEQISDFNKYFHYLKKYENSIIFNTFGWINKKRKKCNNCSNEKIIYQHYFTFDLDIKKAVNDSIMNNKTQLCIYDCIKYATQKETLYNIFCEKCDDKCVFESESSIVVSPNYFAFLLRLNDDNFETINKLKEYFNGIKIEEYLNLNDIIKVSNSINIADAEKKINVNFILAGMVIYIYNKGTNNIEYKAYCCSPVDKNWYKYENEENYQISKIDKSELFNSTNLFPVILIYKTNNKDK